MAHILLETLFYSGGLKSKLYGADARPAHWPTDDRVGLQNDVVLTGQQFAVELARFRLNTTQPAGITWLAVFRPSSDIVGNRDNFCGAGLWLVNGASFDAATALDVLFKTSLQLQQNIPRDYGAPLPQTVDDTFNRAVGFINKHFTFDLDKGMAGFPYGDEMNFSSQYIVLPGSEQDRSELIAAITVACAIRTNIEATRLVFVSGPDVRMDSARTDGKVLRTPSAIYKHGQAISDLLNELFNVRATLQQTNAKRVDSEKEIEELKLRGDEATIKITELERSDKEKDALLDSLTSPDAKSATLQDLDQICGNIISAVETRLDQALRSRAILPTQTEQNSARNKGKSSTCDEDLQAIKISLERIDIKISRIEGRDFVQAKQTDESLDEPSFLRSTLNKKIILISAATVFVAIFFWLRIST